MHRLLAFALAAWLVTPAHAEEWDWQIGYKRPGFVHHHYRPQANDIDRERVRLYREAGLDAEHREHRHDDGRGFHCLDPIRGLGTQWIGTEGALNAARKDWMERVRYDHGERYIDMTNARDEVSRCSRVSIGEVAGQVTYRCEIWARPCQALMEETPSQHKEETAPPEAQK